LQNGDKKVIEGTTIGRKRILTFPSVMAKNITVTIKAAKATALINEIKVFDIPKGILLN